MLTLDRDREFYVYPSWAELPYTWERLPGLLWNPRKSGFLQGDYFADFPLTPPRIEYLDGPGGNGVIVVHKQREERWLGVLVLCSHANIRLPSGRALIPEDPFGVLVTYLEPYDNPLEVSLGLRPKPKLYLCGATPEHAASAGNSVYWLASLDKRKRNSSTLAEVPRWASSFGLSVTELPGIPEQLRSETSDWFVQPAEFDQVWFHVSGGDTSAGFHFAVLVYIAFLARSTVKRLYAMHLVADIEGQPRYRKTWHRR
jgi:hypothetical protein